MLTMLTMLIALQPHEQSHNGTVLPMTPGGVRCILPGANNNRKPTRKAPRSKGHIGEEEYTSMRLATVLLSSVASCSAALRSWDELRGQHLQHGLVLRALRLQGPLRPCHLPHGAVTLVRQLQGHGLQSHVLLLEPLHLLCTTKKKKKKKKKGGTKVNLLHFLPSTRDTRVSMSNEL